MTRIEQADAAVSAARAMFADASALEAASDDEIAALLGAIAELSRLVQAQQVRLAGAVDARSGGSPETDLCLKLGKTSSKEAVAAAFGIRVRDARELLSMARATTRGISLTGADIEAGYPRVAASLDAGELSLAQARAIITTLEPAASRAAPGRLAWAEGCLVAAAVNPEAPLAPELLVDQGRAFAAVIDPDGVLPNGERQRASRRLRLWQRPDGMWPLDALFTPEAGSEFKAFLDAHDAPRIKPSFVEDGASDASEADAGPIDDRTSEQRRHDILLGAVRAQAASGNAPVAGGESPRLVFNVTEEAFDAYRRGVEHPDRTVQIEHTGALVPIETVDRLLCDAVVQRAVVSATGEVLDLGRTQRTFSRAQRRALAAQYGGCANCRAPASWCEAHHVHWWSRGGATDLKNGILLCSHCHHEVHGGRLVVVGEPGNWRVVAQLRPPDPCARATRVVRPRGMTTAPGIGQLARVAAERGARSIAMRGSTPVIPEPIQPGTSGDALGASNVGTHAFDAAPSLTFRIRSRASRAAHRPRAATGCIEPRLRRRLRAGAQLEPPRTAIDYRPRTPVVLRR